jgi:hypothetical protein
MIIIIINFFLHIFTFCVLYKKSIFFFLLEIFIVLRVLELFGVKKKSEGELEERNFFF